GMDAATVKKIFDPFFTTKNAGKGTGLGLSVVHGMVKNMGGIIEVASSPGEGTTMSVYLPLTDKAPTDARKIVALDSGDFRFEGYTVLIAEDEPDLLALLGDMLERLGLKVLRARDGNEALLVQDAHEERIDLLITDVVMPEVNGVKLAELFLSLRPNTKVIFMSGYPATGQLAPVELPKDSFFMAKPVSHENLLLMLKGLLGGDEEALRHAEDSSRHWH
ncbi:MAG TPA: response regulator, partial [Alphaproteobacteria bacterium]|nr:response regulator [Alphaproteobacteria bacterium]